MRSFKTEGIILKRRDFGEADRILTLFSLYEGKITVLAKGVRKVTSRRAGNVELLNRVIVYLHKGRDFYLLTEAESIETFQPLKENLTLSTYAYHLIELVDKLTAENQENRNVYSDLVEVLERLSKRPRQILIRAFEVKILFNLGFWSVDEIEGVDFKIKELLVLLQQTKWPEIEKIKLTETEASELERILRHFLEKTLEGKLKSRQFLKDLTNK